MLANKANNKPGKKDERRKSKAHVGKGYSFRKKHRRRTDPSGRLPGRGATCG